MKKEKKKNFKLRSKVYKRLGQTSWTLSTLGSFFAYESMIDWGNFKSELENFIVLQENTLKLNLMVAFPILISIVIYLIIFLKKNKSYFKDKISMGLLIVILILYLFYSIVEVALATLVGAWVGLVVDEFVFTPLSTSATRKYDDEKELDTEYKKEFKRIKARKMAEEELDGSV